MSKLTSVKKANKIAYVDRWNMHFSEDKEFESVIAEQMPNGKWLCGIELCLINQTIKSVASTEINAMLNTADKATKVIQNYLKNHPEVKWVPLSKFRHWEINTDEYGFVSLNQNSDYRKKTGEKMKMIHAETIKAVNKAIARIEKLNGTDKDVFIQVIDRSFFKEGATNDEIYKKLFDTMYDEHNIFLSTIACDNNNNHIIMVGYTSTRQEFERFCK